MRGRERVYERGIAFWGGDERTNLQTIAHSDTHTLSLTERHAYPRSMLMLGTAQKVRGHPMCFYVINEIRKDRLVAIDHSAGQETGWTSVPRCPSV